ncbi:phosphate acyltransferase PlsX [Thermochromatium tepidum ATCC 43061]|uniref:Phosphate acyltransferase n=2 Tax=Thermochromatium tepidum TaxID=1050 RepID=A0A6I6DZJ0_THETI|nr:phosphate acyltransferase PlsX [Thermochromatium tepidum]QGU33111.1 phosphate acyltransferase PlsX [Thermochromatium tepidum ATCC 43061]
MSAPGRFSVVQSRDERIESSTARPHCTIALDAMGGDHGPQVVVPAALRYLADNPHVDLILVGDEARILSLLGHAPRDRLRIRHTTQEVGMNESPSKALRGKKDSSMRVAIDLVKDGEAQACVSAGNTGALMATARFVLKTLPHIDRPAICTAMPSLHGHTRMLDLGANVDCTAEHLFQFAVMGSELVAAVDGIPRPRVALLNIGQEEIKGNEQVKQAHELLTQSPLNYVGYVEGNGIYLDDLDVVVTDGFVGNVALKSSEGVAKFIAHSLSAQFKRNLLTRLAGLVALPILKQFRRDTDPRRYNGASLLGLRGIVVKSHGSADEVAFENAIYIAEKEIHANIPQRIGDQVARHLGTQQYRESA